MATLLAHTESVLRGYKFAAGDEPLHRTLSKLAAFIVACGLAYGATMGAFGGITGERFFQVIYSAIKVPFLLLATFIISLPSFFVFNTLLGVRDDFRRVLEGLIASQACLTIILLSLAPFTLFWYASSSHYDAAIIFNGLMFGVASVAAQWVLRRYYNPLIVRNSRHQVLLRVWLVIYVFVGIQMGWILRPFIGSPGMPVQFFREGAWGNAYVELANKILSALSGK